MAEYIIETNNLSKYFGSKKACDQVNMHVKRGDIYGFIGRNGAGKTTAMKLILGLLKPNEGEVSLFGSNTNLEASRRKIGSLIETPSLYKNASALENMRRYAILFGGTEEDIVNLLDLVGLGNTGKKKAGKFSLGMRQRLGIAIALCGNPDLIILDEPTNGLDPQGIIEIRELIIKLNKEKGITFLISSHILDELARVATYYGFIDKGRIVKEMSAKELESECRKSIRMKVSDTKILAGIMDAKGIEYSIIDDNNADVFSELAFSSIAKEFEDAGCVIYTMDEHEESLEAFYLSLLGGNENA